MTKDQSFNSWQVKCLFLLWNFQWGSIPLKSQLKTIWMKKTVWFPFSNMYTFFGHIGDILHGTAGNPYSVLIKDFI